MLLRLALLLTVVFTLGACELVVDPEVQSSGSGTATSSSGTGSSGSGSTAGSASGSTGSSGASSGSGSTGSSGSTGTVSCARTGTTGYSASACGAAPTLAPPSDWPVTPIPDSTSTCGASCDPGSDAAWVFPPDQFCSDGSRSPRDGGAAAQFVVSTISRVAWQVDQLGPATASYDAAASDCRRWDGAITLPTPWDSIESMDFGLSNSEVAPPSWNMSYLAPIHWAATVPGVAWRINFDVGSFALSEPDAGPAYVRCVEHGGPSSSGTALTFGCNAATSTGDPQCTLSEPGLPAPMVFDESSLQVNYAGAVDHCDNLDPCGSWRLPSYKELATLVDFITPTGEGRNHEHGEYWTSSTLGGSWAMVIDFGEPDAGAAGHPAYLGRNQLLHVICIHNPAP